MLDKDLKKFIIDSLYEDIREGDHTSLASIPDTSIKKVKLEIKDNGIIAGIDLANMIYKQIDSNLEIESFINDGEKVKYGDIAFIAKGKAISILSGERLILNCMQRMSAIATKTSYLNSLISKTNTKLLDTRKTTPLNRKLEKWAVKIGGGVNHRFGLYDVIMIKDNHIDFAGSIKNAIQSTKKYLSIQKKDLDIIVEARNLKEVKEILCFEGIKRILLDNFDIDTTQKAISMIGNKCETESSGDITEKNILQYAKCGVNYISVGALTHSIQNFDLSLNSIFSDP